jgi:uncharacterized membrane protein YbhN (UPF0104 family)
MTIPTRRRVALTGAWLVATALLVACARTVDWSRAAIVLVAARPSWLLAAASANGAILIWWAAFWRTLVPAGEPRVAWRRMLEIVATASALMNTVPLGGGHASSVVLLARRGGMSRRGAVSVLALDQLGEGITKVSIFSLAALLVPPPLPGWLRAGVMTVSIAVAAWCVVLAIVSRWANELRILKSASRSFAALGCVVAMKGVEMLAIVAVQRAFGIEMSFAGTLLVLAAVILGTMVPLAPANLGTYEACAFVAYRYLGAAPEQALGLAIAQHLCFMVPSVGVGYFFVSANTLSRRVIASR